MKEDCWITDETTVKIQKTPFDEGAMREVYRMKMAYIIRSEHAHERTFDWKKASNFVAKRHKADNVITENIESNRNQKYFDDVKLQFTAEKYAKLYNNTYHAPRFIYTAMISKALVHKFIVIQKNLFYRLLCN
jgi:hypothetical protein